MREYGSEFRTKVLPDRYFSSWESWESCVYLRSGREALAFTARNIEAHNPSVLLPAYVCRSMVDPFERAGWKVEYYRLNDDLTINMESLQETACTVCPSAVLTMNYFGVASTRQAVAWIKDNIPECVCIEDFTHCLFSLSEILDPQVDFYVASIRKSVGIPDGGVVLSNQRINNRFALAQDTDFITIRQKAQSLMREYHYTRDQSVKDEFRKLLNLGEDMLENFSEPHRMSSISLCMLNALNGAEITFSRRNNMEHLFSRLKGFSRIELLPDLSSLPAEAVFSMPILVERRDKWQAELAQQGLYAPVLWPIPDRARKICPVAARMADSMLSIPVDQRYGFEDIESIVSILKHTEAELYG